MSGTLSTFHPVLSEWFKLSFGEPTGVQVSAWKAIADGRHTLIASPTGSGKTLAALLPCLDRLVQQKAAAAQWKQGVRLLYLTPLKALNNDIHHHLAAFIQQMNELASSRGEDWPTLTAGVRTGDTSQSTRASMLRQPPDLLITTPESLYLLLTSVKGREMLQTVEQVIVDEIHDLAADKRGVHLSLTLERLTEWTGRTVQRIGVSATQKPVERIARFLGGWEAAATTSGLPPAGSATPPDYDYKERPVEIVEHAMDKKYDVLVTMPDRLTPAMDKETVWLALVDRLVQLMEDGRTTLIFVNNRRLCERLTLRLNDHFGWEMARSHHGSVSREKRLEVERMLKQGELRCLVATSSLELGIDVGHVDLVIQIDSPKQAAAGIQRIGRAGHSVGDASRGVIVARSRSELPEAAVLARLITARDIEEIRIPRNSLDVLSQQITAMVAVDDWEAERLFGVLTRSDCFRMLPRARYHGLLEVLAGLYPFARPLLEWDRGTGRLQRRSNTPMAAIMGAGTIPQSSGYPVYHAETRQHLGELDEEFVFESRAGDVFQLGTSSWAISSIRHDRIYVTEASNSYSEIPFWRAEALGRSSGLGTRVGAFIAEVEKRLDEQAPVELQHWLMNDYFMDARSADELVAWIRSQRAVCPPPTDKRIVVEHFVDDAKQHHVVLHSVFGRRFNRTWQLALQARLNKTTSRNYYAAAKDNGIEFVFNYWKAEWLTLFRQFDEESLETLLLEALPGTPLLGITFRRLAETSLLLAKGFQRMPSWKKRLRSEELLEEALPYGEKFPFLGMAIKECIEDSLDLDMLKRVTQAIIGGQIEWHVAETRFPSPFASQFLLDYIGVSLYESDTLKQDLQVQLLAVSKELANSCFGRESVAEVIRPEDLQQQKKVLEQGEYSPTGPEELYRWLKEHGDRTTDEVLRLSGEEGMKWLQELETQGRVAGIVIHREQRWICRDEIETYRKLDEDPLAVTLVLKRYADHRISFTAEEIRHRYGLSEERTRQLLEDWAKEEVIEPAPFAESGQEELWISSKVAKRLVRFSIRQFRESLEPVSADRYCSNLMEVQGIPPSASLSDAEALLSAISVLQGIFMPLSVWESYVFPARVAAYHKEQLDELSASGDIVWIGKKEPSEKEGRVAFFLAESRALYAPFLYRPDTASAHPELLQLLRSKGASFLTRLSRETGEAPSTLTDKLLDLVWEGRAANDQLAPLRQYGRSSKPSAASGRMAAARAAAARSGTGRWYAWGEGEAEDSPASGDSQESAMQWARLLLAQYVLVTKETAKDCPFSWDTLSAIYKRLEEWGMVTRGRFVKEIPYLQFADRERAEEFRRSLPGEPAPVMLSAVDPANPYGFTVPWPSLPHAAFARKPGNFLIMLGGEWRLWIENYGKKWAVMKESAKDSALLDDGELQLLLPDLLREMLRQSGRKKLVIEQWDGRRVEDTPAAGWLTRIGAEKDQHKFVLWPSSFR